jgi:hypothetical protein
MRQPDQRAAAAWDRIVREVRAFDGDAVISHEFFSSASKEQAGRAIDALAPAEVHLVYTARDLTRLIPDLWQERLKYRYQGTFADFRPAPVTAPPRAHWSWRTIDAVDVLQRWASTLPPELVHVVTVPRPGAPRTVLWDRFAMACGLDPAIVSLDLPATNESMGLVESELLRRINPRIGEEISGLTEVPTWVRDYLGLRVLAERKGERIGLDPHRHARMRKRSITAVEQLRQAGYDVVGDLHELIAPVAAPPFRQPEDVSTEELLDASLDVIAQMLSDYREVARERQQLRRRVETMSWRHYTHPRRRLLALLRRISPASRGRSR